MLINASPYVADLQRSREAREVSSGTPLKSAGAVDSPGLDQVEISSPSSELARWKQRLDALPDVRLDRVALARQQVQQGGYQVDPKLLAQRMMESVG